MNTKQAKSIIFEHFPCFDYRRVYSEARACGSVIKFWCASAFNDNDPAWMRMREVLFASGCKGIEVVYNSRGGRDLLLSV